MQGMEEWDHQESPVNLEDPLLPVWLYVLVLVSPSLQAGFLCRAPVPVPQISWAIPAALKALQSK